MKDLALEQSSTFSCGLQLFSKQTLYLPCETWPGVSMSSETMPRLTPTLSALSRSSFSDVQATFQIGKDLFLTAVR